jgi:hypothetical protein
MPLSLRLRKAHIYRAETKIPYARIPSQRIVCFKTTNSKQMHAYIGATP